MFFCLLFFCLQTPLAVAQEHAKRGFELWQRGDINSAEAEFREAVRLAPNDEFSLAFLGIILGKQQKLEEADIYLERALRINPGDVNSRFNLAVNQFRLGQSLQAKANLERVLEDKPGAPPAVLLLGTVLEKLQNYQRAASLLESVAELVRQQAESIATLARCYYQTDRREKARETLGGLRSAGAEAVFLGAKTAAQCGDFEIAESLLNSIRSTYPDTAKLGYEIALVQYNAKRLAESQVTLQQLIAAGTRDAKIFNLMSWCYHRQNRLTEAVAAMKQAISLEPRVETNYDHLAQILIEQQHYPDAYEAVKQALVAAPDSALAFKLKGHVESEMGLFKLALESYTRAVKLNPSDPDVLLGLGLVQQKLFKPAEAAATFEKGIARFPTNPQFCQAYGRMLLGPGARRDTAQESHAVSLLEKALALDNSLPEAHFELGRLMLERDRAIDALPHLEAAAKLDPRSSKIHLSLANAYRQLARHSEAASELQVFKKLEAQEQAEPR